MLFYKLFLEAYSFSLSKFFKEELLNIFVEIALVVVVVGVVVVFELFILLIFD